jgi:UDP-N-acetylmuramoyl-tripeptide--D-alanyl-D-alanine ligase
MQIQDLYRIYQANPVIQTDSRKIQKGDLYFALKGPNFNGNSFAEAALKTGAAYAIVDEAPHLQDDRIIVVTDVLSSLQALAKFHRQQFDIPFIAITGSNGKTTTKELVHEVLSSTYKTYTTEGNLNNHIGIPLTLLKIKKDAQFAVIEMGANHQKEIEGYCSYTLPTHGIITNCGKAHLEGFGGIEGVKKGKGELYDYLRAHDGTAFIMWDYDYLQEMSRGIKTQVRYGTHDADFEGLVKNSTGFLEVAITKGADIGIIQTQLVGEYNLPNVLLAVAIGKYFNVADAAIKKALEGYQPSNSRSQLIEKGTNKVILDAYNANPTSMKAAIENFAKRDGANKVLMLGSMMELGSDTEKEHEAIIQLIEGYAWKAVVLVGEGYKPIKNKYINLPDSAAAKDWYRAQAFNNTEILIKGSRSMKMELVLE